MASRLSFGLWDSLPDETLLDAAAVASSPRASRSPRRPSGWSNDPRTRSKVREFFLQWLKVDQPPDIAKDKKRFPGFTPAVASDLRTSLDLFLDDVVWGETSDFRESAAAECST